jgi:dihydroorotase
VLELLRPGDILTHCCTGGNMRLIDEDHHVLSDVRRLHEAGVILDVGHGTGSFSFETAEAMLADGLKPDIISSDIHQMAAQGPAYDLPTTMAKFLAMGMDLEEVIACTTINPARAVGLEDLGTLTPGTVADVAIFRLDEGEHFYYDILMNERPGETKLVNTLTMIDGEVLERTPEREPHFWAVVPEVQQNLPAAGEKVNR